VVGDALGALAAAFATGLGAGALLREETPGIGRWAPGVFERMQTTGLGRWSVILTVLEHGGTGPLGKPHTTWQVI